jgi:Protein of unknown function (DUF3738)
MMCAWSASRSNIALQSRAFGNIVFHSENGKLVVTITADCSARPEITWNSNSAADSGTATYAEAKYDFRLEFVVDRAEVGGGRGVGAGPPREPAAPVEPGASLFDVLQSTLGLKLEPKKVPGFTLVVDHVEKAPTANWLGARCSPVSIRSTTASSAAMSVATSSLW